MDGASAAFTDWLQAGFAGVLTILTYFYVRTTRGQLATMAEALEETRRSNASTEESNRIQREAMIAANRAWIAPVNYDFKAPTPGPTGQKVWFRNSGRYPARRIVGISGFGLSEPKRFVDGSFPVPPGEPVSIPTLFPGTDMTTTLGEGQTFTEDEIGAIQRREIVLYYFATFTYDDGLGQERETRFCVSFDAARGTWEFPSFGNWAT